MATDEFAPESSAKRCSEQECLAVLAQLFPNGFEGEDVLRELAPDGWAQSPLLATFHPSVEKLHEEAVRIHRNIENLPWAKGRDKTPEPTLEEIRAEHQEKPVDPATECRELVGLCLWDIFSDNHEVVAPDCRVVDLGSFRASAGVIAEFLNGRPCGHGYNYMDFYMGTIWLSGRADLGPVYLLLFRRLKALGFDWVYHFPRLMLVDMRPLLDSLKEQEPQEPEWASYDPSKALAEEQERAEHDAETASFREKLDEAHRHDVERAANQPPPNTVAAYQQVYGHLPLGWPPSME